MRAAVLASAGSPLQIIDGVTIDAPRDNEVLVRISHCGVCHSDLSIVDGTMPYPTPAILGHEAAGTIVETGAKVVGRSVGDRVALSMRPPCGDCYWCARNEPVLCIQTATPLGGGDTRLYLQGNPVARGFRLGAFAEYALVEVSGVIPVPQQIPLQSAAIMGCAIQTGLGSVMNIARVEAGATAVVFGLGGVGLSVIQGLLLAEAGKIIGIDPIQSRRSKAEEIGAHVTFDSRATDLQNKVLAATNGIGADYAFDTVATTATTASGIEMLRRGGKLVLIGVSGAPEPLGVTSMDLVMRQKSILGSFLGNCHAQRDLTRYFDLCCSDRLSLAALVTACRPLTEINEAMEDLRRGIGVRTVLTI